VACVPHTPDGSLDWNANDHPPPRTQRLLWYQTLLAPDATMLGPLVSCASSWMPRTPRSAPASLEVQPLVLRQRTRQPNVWDGVIDGLIVVRSVQPPVLPSPPIALLPSICAGLAPQKYSAPKPSPPATSSWQSPSTSPAGVYAWMIWIAGDGVVVYHHAP
jgi:hypothetical protein